ncbi:lethal(2)neighbour of tid protein 2 [Bactrocera tryoni]|uniref:lethal(2)neighbour of tid protein 2 n=1 Tax=Bactrocera tryoni TaxID=59916 RepID=UPI001A97B5AC|nr:lethal(2)neighbour of tid protein 2 [Bactrocera tryoni]
MPPLNLKNHPPGGNKSVNKRFKVKSFFEQYANLEYAKYLFLDPAALPLVSVLILLAELIININVIWRVPYTEIDWIAYMQECEGFLNGTLDYGQLKGDTGPLVYPAAFVYIYSALYYITSYGQNIRLAQYIFAFIYLLQLWLVLRLYTKSRKVPPYVLLISTFTSYRIHSIYVLRLFNDPIAVLFLYAALNLFFDRRWTIGSICFSVAVGVKMNILLFAPALLLFYIVNLGYLKTILQLAICGGLQLLLGAPFLITYPKAYLKGSFDFERVFEHKWTVNYRFLTRSLFENKAFHAFLIVVHMFLLLLFANSAIIYFKSYVRLRALQDQLQPQIDQKNMELEKNRINEAKNRKKSKKVTEKDSEEELTPDQQQFLKSFEKGLQNSTGLKPNTQAPPPIQKYRQKVSIHFEKCSQLAILPFFLCNFLGMLCARSLHYQFYVWYYHSLPYLIWSTNYSLGIRFLLLGLIELCWNTYPSTDFSSGLLHICHIVLLLGVGSNFLKATKRSEVMKSFEEKRTKVKVN